MRYGCMQMAATDHIIDDCISGVEIPGKQEMPFNKYAAMQKRKDKGLGSGLGVVLSAGPCHQPTYDVK